MNSKTKSSSNALSARKFDAYPDRIDIRDWTYQPSLAPLPDELVNCHRVPQILDQGNEGACTGFALGAVINYLLANRSITRRVSPRMLYEMARRYDEWPGEAYDGSSARGAMKGWVAHGVCTDRSWPQDLHGPGNLSWEISKEATGTPGGAYYRVTHRNVRDMHAALNEVGILYATLMVHDGWGNPDGPAVEVPCGKTKKLRIPTIRRQGRADGGHAIAIVGYTKDGFIIQNSWGPAWGKHGFAMLPYEDYMLHATDVWVAQLGVPINVDTWQRHGIDSTGISRAAQAVPLHEIRPYVIDVGNNGELSDSGAYWTTPKDLNRLFNDIIPADTKKWQKRRVMLYLHGGLNDERAVARRIMAFRDVFLANEIYPLHIMWESGVTETLNGMVRDLFTDDDERAKGWFSRLRDGLIEAKDRSFEITTAAVGSALWSEMKENARMASTHPDGVGAMQLVANEVNAAMKKLNAAERQKWELHIVGHSAGSIFAAHALPVLINLGVSFKSLQFLAPAITVDSFKKLVLPLIDNGACPRPSLYILKDKAELDDTVGPYGKSLLYLVSNAFEKKRETPILGMERFVRQDLAFPKADKELDGLFSMQVNGWPSLILAGDDRGPAARCFSKTHGGFDNDAATLNAVIRRILEIPDQQKLTREFNSRDLEY